MTKWRKPKTKNYRGLQVDARLDTSILDILNSNPNVRVRGVCAGHNKPTEPHQRYYGNVPELVITPKRVSGTCKKLRKGVKHARCWEDNKNKLITIRGTRKGSKDWWRRVSEAVYGL